MRERAETAIQTEIVHVLFIDIVGYSTLTTSAQSRFVHELNELVAGTEAYSEALQARCLLVLPTGDGMALLFSGEVSSPARCSIEVSKGVQSLPFKLRMGIHSGVVQEQPDIMGNQNVAGEGINIAQRVMDLGDAGHILLSEQYARWLLQLDRWKDLVQELGEGVAKHGLRLKVWNLSSLQFGNPASPEKVSAPSKGHGQLEIVVLYRRNLEPDGHIVGLVETHFRALGHEVFIDRHLKIGVEWARAIEERIRRADAVVAIVSEAGAGSEMLEFELETSLDEFKERGKPFVYPIRVGSDQPLPGFLGSMLNSLQFIDWSSPADDARVLEALTESVRHPNQPPSADYLEPAGGAVMSDSPFYVERTTDAEFLNAVRASESVILVKGPRQIGKTSLIARGVSLVEDLGWRMILTDFQKFSSAQLGSEEKFYRILASTIAKQIGMKYDWENEWLEEFGCNLNLDNFMRAALDHRDEPLVWFMDEADRLFGVPFASDFFGLVRSWHNSRAMERRGPWRKLTLVIGYATEAHLFIQDLNQSPFNIGLQLPLEAFNLNQMKELNRLYGQPLTSGAQIEELYELIAGQPFLTRRAFDVLARKQLDFGTLLATADRDDGPFGDHLKRILLSVSQMPAVLEAMKQSLTNVELRETEGFHRLVAAGVMWVTPENKVAFRTPLYQTYLSAHVQ